MECPICESVNTKVMDCRMKQGKFYRRRKCLDCGEKFTTYEINLPQLSEIFEDKFSHEVNVQIASILDREFKSHSWAK